VMYYHYIRGKMMIGIKTPSKSRGFTVIELIVIISIMAAFSVFAAAAIFGALGTFTMNSATTKLINDIRYTQQLARTRNGWYGIRFQTDPTNQYNVYSTDGSTDTNVTNPANRAQDFVIYIDDDFNGVIISGVNIAGGDKVEFNPRGMPFDDVSGTELSSNGMVTLNSGTSSQTIRIIPNTGRVELQ